MMKTMCCFVCRGETIEPADVQEEIKVGSDIVYVPVRVLVCGTCGERYYDRHTIRYLENVDKELQEGRAMLREVGKILVYG